MKAEDEEILKKSHEIVLQIAEKLKPTIENPLTISSQELALNLEVILEAKGPLLSQDAESYRELIIGLNEKLKVLQIAFERIDCLRCINQKLLREKEIREASQLEMIKNLEELQKSMESKLAAMQSDNRTITEELRQAKAQLENSRLCEDELRIELEDTKGRLEQQNSVVGLLKAQGHTSSALPGDSPEDFVNIKESLLASLLAHCQPSEDLQSAYASLLQDSDTLQAELLSAKEKLDSEALEKNSLKSKVADLESDLKSQEASLKCLSELESNYESLQNLNGSLKKQNEIYASSIKSLTSDSRYLASELNALKEKSNAQIQSLNNKVLQQDSKLQESLSKLKSVEDDLHYQSGQNDLLCKKLSSANSSAKIALEELAKTQKNLFDSQRKTEADLDKMASNALLTSRGQLQQDRNLKKLEEIITEKDSELTILREMITELQKPKPSYFPIKDDPVDSALADFINSRPPLEINFIREDQGLYVFGSKRVFIKIENGKIISNPYTVRVGGGFMRIDEFVELYTPLEVEKLDERKKFENSPARKNSVGKLGMSDRSRQELSAQKAAAIIQDTFVKGKTNFATCLAVPRKAGDSTPKKNQRKSSVTDRPN